MSAERHVLYRNLYIHWVAVELDPLHAVEDLVSHGALYTVTRHDHHVLLTCTPLLEDCQ